LPMKTRILGGITLMGVGLVLILCLIPVLPIFPSSGVLLVFTGLCMFAVAIAGVAIGMYLFGSGLYKYFNGDYVKGE
jgi:hypothetical protein